MDMDIQTQAPDDYSSALYLRCHSSLPQAIRQAAREKMTSASASGAMATLRRGMPPNGDLTEPQLPSPRPAGQSRAVRVPPLGAFNPSPCRLGRPIPRNASRTETFEASKGDSMPINSQYEP
jgi:hypothetical protein